MTSPDIPNESLPDVLAGPLLRRLSPERLRIWLVASRPLALKLFLHPEGHGPRRLTLGGDRLRCLPLGRHAHLHLIDLTLETPLPLGVRIDYDLRIVDDQGDAGIADWAPHLLHAGARRPAFVLCDGHHRLLHGSCRRPHHDGPDGLVRADAWLAERRDTPEAWPSWLLMTGDQIYADDVAGPMLVAIHALIRRLGLFDESLEGATVADSQALYAAEATYYQREALLPDMTSSADLRERFFGGVKKPVFTSANAHNHLMTFGEIIAMYLLVWSPTPWRLVEVTAPSLGDENAATFATEQAVIERFVEGLPAAARLLAHLPSLMIFDDHDITDDWNLTAAWEQTAYDHPFSRRIIGNALLGYLLCQGWGNDPDRLATSLDEVAALLEGAMPGGWLTAEEQDTCIQHLLRFEGWEFQVPGPPKLVVLDTRTRRWRSERNPRRPSGLMDWEALSDFQQELLDAPSVIIVSAAPMFGVKLIEAIQKLFTLAGKPLLVDAENWMAHRGAASVMLNIFRHSRTPGHYVILSGDVHYSFAYDIRIRQRRQGPQLWQITSSGIKNAFPDTLLDWFDRANRWLYAPRSPLNWFTKRRRMRIRPRDPDRARAGERLWNGAGIGLVELDDQGRPSRIAQLDARGFDVEFPPPPPGRD
ncbi:alkaline phosphatase family protein [Halomonas nitroreducens]|uniref:Alkaline phosphatase family protein n=1 Tax=Halomonas nitroreducens TaxID=447425 RepID=A0A3S0I7G8_9GAMM|nr:alkaline phosphatase family protein [Halomonas nitroreducens]RTR02932.1 alkaline phosphatase family protein [Halomonas nitroreducens]